MQWLHDQQDPCYFTTAGEKEEARGKGGKSTIQAELPGTLLPNHITELKHQRGCHLCHNQEVAEPESCHLTRSPTKSAPDQEVISQKGSTKSRKLTQPLLWFKPPTWKHPSFPFFPHHSPPHQSCQKSIYLADYEPEWSYLGLWEEGDLGCRF